MNIMIDLPKKVTDYIIYDVIPDSELNENPQVLDDV